MVLSPPHTPASSEDTRVLASSTPCLRIQYWIWSELLGKGQEERVCKDITLCSFPFILAQRGQIEPTQDTGFLIEPCEN